MTPYYEKTFQRHRDDLKANKPNLRFNEKLGMAYIRVIQSLKHYKGEKANKLIELEPWQKKVVLILFGWERKKEDGSWVRRFRTGFIFIPRKNGKTLLGAGMMIADMLLRKDEGGETAFFATKRDQAKLAYTPAVKMLKNHPELAKMTKESYGKTIFSRCGTEIYTLGRDSTTLDGLNVSRGFADEHHAHPDDSLWDVVKSSQMARKQPLMLSITTAGFNVASPAYNLYDYSKKVLDKVLEDDTLFAFIAEAGKKPKYDADFYFKEETWKIANPNYGVSIDKEELALASKEAKERPEKLNNFLVKYLNVWTTSSQSYLPLDDWQKCQGEVKLIGKAVEGDDYSIRDDFSSRARLYKVDGKFHIKMSFYIPRERIYERERELKVPLMAWVKEGWITATEGNSINQDFIMHDIEQELQQTEAFCYDPYQARTIVNRLEELGFEDTYPIRQGYLTLSEPTAWLLKLIRDGGFVHDGNPVLTWMISNVAVLSDPAGNIKPNKSDINRKIDGVASIINCLAYLIHDNDSNKPSIYEERGLRSL